MLPAADGHPLGRGALSKAEVNALADSKRHAAQQVALAERQRETAERERQADVVAEHRAQKAERGCAAVAEKSLRARAVRESMPSCSARLRPRGKMSSPSQMRPLAQGRFLIFGFPRLGFARRVRAPSNWAARLAFLYRNAAYRYCSTDPFARPRETPRFPISNRC